MCYDGTDRKNVNTTNDITDQAERLSIEVDSSPSSTDLMSPPNACLWMTRSEKIRSLATSIEMRWGTLLFKPVWLRATQQKSFHTDCLPRRREPQQFIFLFSPPNRLYELRARIAKALKGKVPHITPASWCDYHPTSYTVVSMPTVMAIPRDWCNVWHLVI